MSRPPLAAVCDLLVEVGRPMQRERIHDRTCIAATKLAVETLAYFGYTAKPIAVRVDVLNPVATSLHTSGVALSNEHHALGARLVTIMGTGRQRPGRAGRDWDGHLVAFAPTPGDENVAGIIVDLALDQTSRPAKGVEVGPVAFTVGHGWETRQFGVTVSECAVIYERISDDRWRQAPDWRGGDARRHIGELIRRLSPYLEGATTDDQ